MAINSDDFNDGAIDASWTFVDPTGNNSVSESGGEVSITVASGAAYELGPNNKDGPRLLQALPSSDVDFDVSLAITSTPTEDNQWAGLCLFGDDGTGDVHIVVVAYNNRFGGLDNWWVDNIDGDSREWSLDIQSLDPPPTHIRMTRTTDGSGIETYTFYSSADGGDTWTQRYTNTYDGATEGVTWTDLGFWAGSTGDNAGFVGTFDWIEDADDPLGGASDDIAGTSSGTATATGTVSAYSAASGASAGAATATADISGTANVSGSAAGTATSTAGLSGIGAVAASVGGTASTTGTLTATANATGAGTGTGTATATIAAYANAAGSSAGASAVTGSLTAGGDIAGTTVGTSSVTGTLTATGTLGGASAGLASLSATLAAWGDLAGVGAGVATSTGTLVAWANGAGAAAGAATASGTVDNAASADLSGTAAGTSTATATISASASVSGSASGVATATADIAGLAALSGAASGTSVAAADIAGLVDTSGNAAGAATATGSLAAYANAVGTAAGVGTASGTIENANAGTVAGSAAGTSSATATLRALASVSGSVAGTSSATATIGNANVDGAPEPEDPDIIATPFGFVEIPLWFYPYVRRLQWRIPVKISAWLSDVEREIALAEIADATKSWAQWQVVEDRPDLGGPYKLTLRAKSRTTREEREVAIEFLPIHRRTRAQFLAHLKIASDQLRL